MSAKADEPNPDSQPRVPRSWRFAEKPIEGSGVLITRPSEIETMVEDDYKHQYALLVDPQTGQEFNLCRFATSVGRAVSCDVVLSDKSISRQHAIIYCVKGKFFVEDIGSTNGTSINKSPITTRVPLNSGDELRVGLTPLLFLQIPDRNSTNIYIDESPTVPKAQTSGQTRAVAKSL